MNCAAVHREGMYQFDWDNPFQRVNQTKLDLFLALAFVLGMSHHIYTRGVDRTPAIVVQSCCKYCNT